MIRCGRLSVEGEAVETPISKPRQQRHKKSPSNPYSSRGLDKFARLNQELSTKREYVATKTGTPEDMVRFAHSTRGWVPVLVKNGNNAGASILPPTRTKQDNQSEENSDSITMEKDADKGDEGCENGVNGSASSQETVPVIVPWWSGYLTTTAIGVLTVSAILVTRSAVSAAAMTVVMGVGFLQSRWLGGVICMKTFMDIVLSYFSKIFPYRKSSLGIKTRLTQAQGGLQVQKSVASTEHNISNKKWSQGGSLLTRQATVFSAPKSSRGSQKPNTQLEDNNKKKKFEMIVSMDDQPRKPIRSQNIDSFMMTRRRPGRGVIDPTTGATVIIIVVFFLVFFGRLSAICFTSAWWYVMPIFKSDGINASNGNNRRMLIDLQSRDYRK